MHKIPIKMKIIIPLFFSFFAFGLCPANEKGGRVPARSLIVYNSPAPGLFQPGGFNIAEINLEPARSQQKLKIKQKNHDEISFITDFGIATFDGIMGSAFMFTSLTVLTNGFSHNNLGHVIGILIGAPLGYYFGAVLGPSIYREKKGKKTHYGKSFLYSLAAVSISGLITYYSARQENSSLLQITIPASFLMISLSSALAYR